jgi:hypothetical protein
MYAALVKLTIEQARAPAVAASLKSEILPRVKSAEGFVGGYWLDLVDSAGFGFVLFKTEDQARRAAPPQSSWSVPGVTILGVDVRRVAVAIP